MASIVPLLQNELRATEAQHAATLAELDALSLDSLKKNANMFREHFSRALAATIQVRVCVCACARVCRAGEGEGLVC